MEHSLPIMDFKFSSGKLGIQTGRAKLEFIRYSNVTKMPANELVYWNDKHGIILTLHYTPQID